MENYQFTKEHEIAAIHWNRCYEPWRIARDSVIKTELAELNIATRSFNGSLLWEPWEALKKDDNPYRVFTPYFKNCRHNAASPRHVLPDIGPFEIFENTWNTITVDDLELLPDIKWDKKLETHWQIGETAAQDKLQRFTNNGLKNYKKGRDFPALNSVSRLSPHLHFGEISPHQAWHSARMNEESDDLNHFLSELGCREFSHSLLYHFPDLPRENLQTKFDIFPWLDNNEHLELWKTGQTGHPIVDAGMRELWQTGYMHNRVRMIVGSFLVKNLLLDWRHGKEWFWDCLLDADLANNSAGWQWIAGCGADAAPYFRVFNPSTQGNKFDPQGEYTRRYVPELQALPNKYLFSPWEASDDILKEAGVTLGKDYPKPIVDLKLSRLRALEAFQSLKANIID